MVTCANCSELPTTGRMRWFVVHVPDLGTKWDNSELWCEECVACAKTEDNGLVLIPTTNPNRGK